MYQLEGTIILDDGTELLNPEWEMVETIYNQRRKKAIFLIELIVTTTHGQELKYLSRFEADCNESWTKEDAFSTLLAMPEFQPSTLL